MRKKGAKSVYIIADFSRSVNHFSTPKGEITMSKSKRHNETASAYRAAIYARYSSSGQREESIEGQIRECTDFAERNGITIVKIYADKAVSGKSTDKRDEFRQMMKDAEKGIFNAVICWKIDRFARNRYDSATHKAKLKKHGIRLFYAKESIPEGPEGIILESVMEGYAEYYSENLAQNVRRGNYESALECKTLGHMCLGYQTSPEGKYQINPETAPTIRYIFEEYANGASCVAIAAALNEKGCRTLTGGSFTAKGLAKILNNEKYIGVYTYLDTVRIEDGVPALISQELAGLMVKYEDRFMALVIFGCSLVQICRHISVRLEVVIPAVNGRPFVKIYPFAVFVVPCAAVLVRIPSNLLPLCIQLKIFGQILNRSFI